MKIEKENVKKDCEEMCKRSEEQCEKMKSRTVSELEVMRRRTESELTLRKKQMEIKKEFSGGPIRLNVGGQLFVTTLETLQKDKDSKLSLLFSGDSDEVMKIDKDTYFLDEKPEIFDYILEFLRNGKLEASDDSVPH
eukprot:UN26416